MPLAPVQVYRDNGLATLPLQQPYFMYNQGGYIDPDAERYGFGGIMKSVAPMLAGTAVSMIPGVGQMAAPWLLPTLAGGITGFGLGGFDNIMDAITGGLAGWAGGGLGGALKAAAGSGAGTLAGTNAAAQSVGAMPVGAMAPSSAPGGFLGGVPASTAPAAWGGTMGSAVTAAPAGQLAATQLQGGTISGVNQAAANNLVGAGPAYTGTSPAMQPRTLAEQALKYPGNTAGKSYLDSGLQPQTVPQPADATGSNAPGVKAQSFGDYMKDKLTDPTTLGLGAASLMLTDMNQQQEWDDSAGTFPEVNRALTDEERASYAMKGLTDPNRTSSHLM